MADKKTAYHSDLVQLSGEDGIEVLIKSDVLPSKFKNGGHFVQMEIGGADRTYKVENENCAQPLMGMEGTRVVLRAYGSREEAGIDIIEVLEGEPDAPQGAEPPPPQRQTRQAAPQRSGNRPPARQPAKGQVKPAAKQAAAPQKPAAPAPATPARPQLQTPKQLVGDARARAYRIEQVWLLALERAVHARKFAMKHFDYELSDAMIQSCVGTIAVQLLRDGWHHQMPTDGTLGLVIVEAKDKVNAKADAAKE